MKKKKKSNSDFKKKLKQRDTRLKALLAEQRKETKILIKRNLELSEDNEKLQELNKIKSDFISIVAHQLRTPLSGMKWTLSMLLKGDMGTLNSNQKTFLTKSYDSNARMIALVDDMLVADGIQSGRFHYWFKHIDIIDLIDKVVGDMNAQNSDKNVSIVYKNKPEDLPHVYIDPEKMRVVLQNLLDNAIKYTIEGGKVEINIKRETDHLVISIADNGIGIPKDQIKDAFTKFFRARNVVRKRIDGSGLGLYITKTIVEKNGGTIWFDSVEGKGSTFYFTIPLQANH